MNSLPLSRARNRKQSCLSDISSFFANVFNYSPDYRILSDFYIHFSITFTLDHIMLFHFTFYWKLFENKIVRKLFHRPAVALASVLALIFVIILFKSYCYPFDDLTTSLSQTEIEIENISNFPSESEDLPKRSGSDSIGPQSPKSSSRTTEIPNRQITFGYLYTFLS